MKRNYLNLIILTLLITSQYFVSAAMDTVPNLAITEQMNSSSKNLDALTPLEIASLMNQEDACIATAITLCLPQIATGIEVIAQKFKDGGRLIYLGAGSSGRLGVLDASECVPTFSAPLTQVVGIIAGGDRALRTSIEGVEDDGALGKQNLIDFNVSNNDVVCGISASGSAAYVAHALRYARELGCYTILICCNTQASIGKEVDCCIAAEVGPEVLTGSTRLKAGTATKMVLNMLTTGAFTVYGKVYKNLMIDVKPVNKKLVKRCHRIISTVCDIDEAQAALLFAQSGDDIKTAIVMQMFTLDCGQAKEALTQHNGILRDTIKVLTVV